MRAMRDIWVKRTVICLSWCVVFNGLFLLSNSWADDHSRESGIFAKHRVEKGFGHLGNVLGGKADEGNETTGQIAAWSLAAANLSVVLSLLIKGVRRFAPLNARLKESLLKFNSMQKKHLMQFHYLLNPIILIVALLHFSLSSCRSTSLPEWGLLIMGGIVLLGVVLKFRLCSKSFLSSVYKIHTQPALLILFITVLFIGHMMVD